MFQFILKVLEEVQLRVLFKELRENQPLLVCSPYNKSSEQHITMLGKLENLLSVLMLETVEVNISIGGNEEGVITEG